MVRLISVIWFIRPQRPYKVNNTAQEVKSYPAMHYLYKLPFKLYSWPTLICV